MLRFIRSSLLLLFIICQRSRVSKRIPKHLSIGIQFKVIVLSQGFHHFFRLISDCFLQGIRNRTNEEHCVLLLIKFFGLFSIAEILLQILKESPFDQIQSFLIPWHRRPVIIERMIPRTGRRIKLLFDHLFSRDRNRGGQKPNGFTYSIKSRHSNSTHNHSFCFHIKFLLSRFVDSLVLAIKIIYP